MITATGDGGKPYQAVPADRSTGLQKPSQVIAGKIMGVRRERCGGKIGRTEQAAMASLIRNVGLV